MMSFIQHSGKGKIKWTELRADIARDGGWG